MADAPLPGLAGLRVGQGFDVHPWSEDPGRCLVLGGVRFEESPGLAGHSDADVAAHACTDAILGAAGLGDIGTHFPDSDPTNAGADSVDLLRRAATTVSEAGWTVLNIDCTIVLDAPRIAPHRRQMEERLTAAVGAPVTVKGKRTEGVGGLQEAVHGFAVALVIASPVADATSGPNEEVSK